jgi:uncharacterized protein YndB with AHSA1/START domain
MESEMQAVRISRKVKASPEAVYKAFTRDVSFREWLSDSAYTQNRVGGKLLLVWNSGYAATGSFEKLDEDRQVVFTWQGLGESEMSRVQVDIEPAGESCTVMVAHTGIGMGEGSQERMDQITKDWEGSLENLQSVLEDGLDLRITRRPMLGILVDFMDDVVAKRLGLLENKGIRLGDVLDGMGAQAAGLQKDDVIVRIGEVDINSGQDLPKAIDGKYTGDTITVGFYRDGELQSVDMTLSGRWIPDVPASAVEFAAEIEKMYAQVMEELDTILEGVSEDEASKQPAEGEWNAKEVIAHLTLGERDTQYYIGTLLSDDETIAALNNQPARIKAFLAAHPTLKDVRAELARAQMETVVFIREMPDRFVSYKPTYSRLGQGMLQGAFHPQLHFDQIRSAIEAARS